MISVLYVDDEPDLLEITRIYLEQIADFKVTTSLSAKDGLEKLATAHYDAVISDYMMPVMDGIVFLTEVRSRIGNIPFILFTGRGREDVVIQALNSGADFYLQKGGDPKAQFAELQDKVKKAVEQRQVTDALRDSEQRLADIINFLPDATFAINRDGQIIAWNKAIETMTGVLSTDMLGRGDFEYALPFYHERRPILIDLVFKSTSEIDQWYSHIHREKDILSAITSLPRPKGETATLFGKASPLYNRKGEIVGAIESIRDVTDRVMIEKELRDNQQQFEEMAGTVPGVIYQFYARPDGSMGLNYVNGRVREILGIDNTPADFFERFTEQVHPADRQPFLESIRQAVSSGSPWNYEGRFAKPTGETIWFTGMSRPVPHGDELVYNGVILDITARKQAEEALRESEEMYRLLAENSPAMIYVVDADGYVSYVNSVAARQFHASPEKIVGKLLSDLFPAPAAQKHLDAIRQVISKKIPVNRETREEFPSGVRWIDVHLAPIIRPDGSVTTVLGLSNDITDRSHAGE